MSEQFDPYHRWLGIPPKHQPPDHYRLLGISQFESDPEVIENGADARMAHVRTHQAGKYSAISQQLLNELAAAKLVLLKPEKKEKYDAELRAKLAPQAAPAQPVAAPMPVATLYQPPVPSAPQPIAASQPAAATAPRPGGGFPVVGNDGLRHRRRKSSLTGPIIVVVVLLAVGAAFFALKSKPVEKEPGVAQNGNSQTSELPVPTPTTTEPPTNTDTPEVPGKATPPDSTNPPSTTPPGTDNPVGPVEPPPRNPETPSTTVGELPGLGTVTPTADSLAELLTSSTNPAGTYAQPSAVRSLGASDDSTMLVVAGDEGMLRLIDTAGGQIRQLFKGHQMRVNAAQFLPDQDMVVSVSDDSSLGVWDVTSGTQRRSYLAHVGSAVALSVGATGQRVATAGSDLVIKFWDLRANEETGQLAEFRSPIRALALLDDGRQVAVAGGSLEGDDSDNALHLWRIQALNRHQEIAKCMGHTQPISAIAVAGNDRILTASYDGTVRVWSLPKGESLKQLHVADQPLSALDVCPGGKRFLVGSRDGTVRLWDLEGEREIAKFAGHTGPVRSVLCLADGRLAASGGDDKQVLIWRLPDRTPPAVATTDPPFPPLPGTETEPPPTREKLPVPEGAERADAITLVKEVFKADLDNARTPQERQELAKRMLTAAVAPAEKPASRYVLLEMVLEASQKVGDPITAWQAVEALDYYYEVDALRLRIGILRETGRFARTPVQNALLTKLALNLILDGVAANEIDAVQPLVTLAVGSARRSNDTELQDAAKYWNQQLRNAGREYKKVEQAEATLETQPEDGASHDVVGRYLAAFQGNWEAALPHMARSNDETLAKLAEQDLDQPRETAAQQTLGDGWWDYASSQSLDYRNAFQRRAAHWYLEILPTASPLVKAKLKNRTDTISPAPSHYDVSIPPVPGLPVADAPVSPGLPQVVAGPSNPKLHRQLAQVVIQLRGQVQIVGQRRSVRRLDEIPPGDFVVDSVYVGTDNLTDVQMQAFQGVSEVQELRLEGRFTDAGLANLSSLNQLRQLTLRSPQITGAGLSHLAAAANSLTSLNISGDNVSDDLLKPLGTFAQLEQLNIQGSVFSGTGLAAIKLPMLRSLTLTGPRTANEALAALKNMPRLFLLDLSGNITSEGLENLIHVPQLQRLTLNGAGITDTAFKHIGNLKQLESLSLERIGFTGAGLANLREMPRFRSLTIRQCPRFSPAYLAGLGASTGLDTLTLNQCPTMTDAAAPALAKLNLRSLSLEETPLSDASVPSLSRLKGLRELRLRRTNITPAGANALKTALPNCRVR